MKIKVYYEAVRTMEIDVDEKYRSLCEKANDDYTKSEEVAISDMIDDIDTYIQQIDPDFVNSTGMVGIDVDVDWEW